MKNALLQSLKNIKNGRTYSILEDCLKKSISLMITDEGGKFYNTIIDHCSQYGTTKIIDCNKQDIYDIKESVEKVVIIKDLNNSSNSVILMLSDIIKKNYNSDNQCFIFYFTEKDNKLVVKEFASNYLWGSVTSMNGVESQTGLNLI
jgi:hypothetical protein